MSSKKYDIKAIRVYQAVTFEGAAQTFFSNQEIKGRRKIGFEINEKLLVVELKTDKDNILIPFTNIAGIYLRTEKDKIKKEEPAKTVGIKSTEIKRPR